MIADSLNSSTPRHESHRPMMRRLLSRRFEHQEGSFEGMRLSAEQKERIDEFLKRVRIGEYGFVHESCPCGLPPDDVMIAEIDRYGLPLDSVLCLGCGTIRIDPYLDRPSLDHFYSRLYQVMYARATDLPAYFERQRAYGQKLLETYIGTLAPGAAVLEIGCGAGGGLSVFQHAGYPTAGCDYSRELVDYGASRGVPNLAVGGLHEGVGFPGGSPPALIYLHHVFEHVIDPLDVLHGIKERLAPGGKALLIVPDISRVDRFANPAGDVMQFLHVAHKYNYSLGGLQRLAVRAGLSARRITPSSPIQTAWSTAPELWVELTAAAGSVAHNGVPRRAGRARLRYLQFTEACFRAGLCRAQLRRRFQAVSRRFRA
jgi:SAM-dependent methyltransferase